MKCWHGQRTRTAKPGRCNLSREIPIEEQSKRTRAAWKGSITIEPGKPSGRPRIRGMRITVTDLLGYLAAGMSEAEILADFPYHTVGDIHACLVYAADRDHQTPPVPR